MKRGWFWAAVLVGIALGEIWAVLDPDLPTLTQWIVTNVPWWAALLFGLWMAWHFGIRYARLPWGPLKKQRVEAAAMPRAVIVTVSVRDELGGMSAPGTAEILINEAPVIDQILISPPIVVPGGQATIIVLARDPEGGELTYSASVSEGTIVPGSAPNVFLFTAPVA